jgi:hypothetical protein
MYLRISRTSFFFFIVFSAVLAPIFPLPVEHFPKTEVLGKPQYKFAKTNPRITGMPKTGAPWQSVAFPLSGVYFLAGLFGN